MVVVHRVVTGFDVYIYIYIYKRPSNDLELAALDAGTDKGDQGPTIHFPGAPDSIPKLRPPYAKGLLIGE